MYTYIAAAQDSSVSAAVDGRRRVSSVVKTACATRRTREKIKAEVQVDSDKWENLYLAAGSPEKILLVGFKSEKLKPLNGQDTR